jgi:hypothetical protein
MASRQHFLFLLLHAICLTVQFFNSRTYYTMFNASQNIGDAAFQGLNSFNDAFNPSIGSPRNRYLFYFMSSAFIQGIQVWI